MRDNRAIAVSSAQDTGVPPLGERALQSILDHVKAVGGEAETTYLEVKSPHDMGSKATTAEVAKFLHGAANRRPDDAVRHFHGYAAAKKTGPAVTDDLVNREFTGEVPNRLWLTDIIEHRTAEDTLHLCAVKDVFTNRFVRYALDRRMKSALAVASVEDAVARRGRIAVVGCVVHSDRGSQFRSRRYQRALAAHRLAGSMGRVGVAGDNAAMESFFSTLQKNVLNAESWGSRDRLRRRIIHWIERTYHRRRRQRRLGKLTPVEYETVYTQGVGLAA